MLVLAKTYTVAKAAIVPTVVDSDAGLVEANSKLQLIAGLAGVRVRRPRRRSCCDRAWAATVFLAAIGVRRRVGRVVPGARDHGGRGSARRGANGPSCAARACCRPRPRWAASGRSWASSPSCWPSRCGADRRPPSGTALGTTVGRTVSDMTVDRRRPGARPGRRRGTSASSSRPASGSADCSAPRSAPFVRRHIREEMLLLAAMGVAAAGGLAGLLFGGLTGQTLLVVLRRRSRPRLGQAGVRRGRAARRARMPTVAGCSPGSSRGSRSTG